MRIRPVENEVKNHYDSTLKIASSAFVDALIQFTDLPEDDYEVVSCEIHKPGKDVKIMDILLKGKKGYVNIEFHKKPLSKTMLERDFEYVVQCYLFYGETIDQKIVLVDKEPKSVDKLQIMPDLEYKPNYYYIPDIDGASVLNSIKYKIEHNEQLTEYEKFVFSIIPFTQHGWEDEEALVFEVCHLTEKLNVSERDRDSIAMCQFVLVDLIIDDEELKEDLLGVIAMCDSYIVKREKRLIENAKKEARAESEQKLAYARKEVDTAKKEVDNAEKRADDARKEADDVKKRFDDAKKESTETKIVLKEIADNIDEEGTVKLDKNSIQKILAITSKL